MNLALYPSRVRSSDLLGITLGWAFAFSPPGFSILVPLGVLVGIQVGVLTDQRPEDIEGRAHCFTESVAQQLLFRHVFDGLDDSDDLIHVGVQLSESRREFFRCGSIHVCLPRSENHWSDA
jgi:hypothetical protein